MSRINKRSGDIDFLSIAEGGTGASSMAGFKTNNNILPKNSPKAVILGPGGAFPTSAQFTGDIAGKPILTGSFEGIPNQTLTYTISNFDSFTNYTVSSTDGAISIVDDVITFVPGNNTSGNIYFTVNNNSYTVAISSLNPTAPTIQLSGLSDGVQTVITVQGSGFTSPANATLTSMSVQVATDPSFATVAGTSNAGLTPNITVNSVGVFYVRAKFIDSASRESNWSAVKNIDSATLSNTIATPTMVVKATKNGTGAKFEITGSSFYETTGKTHKSTIYQISGNAGFTDIIYNNTDSTNKTLNTITVPDQKTTYYVRIKYVSSNDGQSYWSAVSSFNYAELPMGFPLNETARLNGTGVTNSDTYGKSFAISGDGNTVFVGAPTTNGGGKIYIFTKTGNTWTQSSTISGTAVYEAGVYGYLYSYAGQSLGTNYDGTLVVTQETLYTYSGGSTWSGPSPVVYRKNISNGTWTKDSLFYSTPKGPGTTVNVKMSSDGNVIAIGYNRIPIGGSSATGGVVSIFYYDGTKWVHDGQNGSYFDDAEYGYGLDISGDGSVVVVSGPLYYSTTPFYYQGRVDVFVRAGNKWTVQTAILSQEPSTSYQNITRTGQAVRISKDGVYIAVKALRYVDSTFTNSVIFIYKRSGNVWNYVNKIEETSPSDNCDCIAINSTGDLIAVANKTAGTVKYYSRTNENWTLAATINKANGDTTNFPYGVLFDNDVKTLAISEYSSGDTLGSLRIYN